MPVYGILQFGASYNKAIALIIIINTFVRTCIKNCNGFSQFDTSYNNGALLTSTAHLQLCYTASYSMLYYVASVKLRNCSSRKAWYINRLTLTKLILMRRKLRISQLYYVGSSFLTTESLRDHCFLIHDDRSNECISSNSAV